MYPIVVKLEDRDALVVGGGAEAWKKVQGLRSAGAEVTVVSPNGIEDIQQAAAEGEITWVARPFEEADLEGMALVITATGIAAVERRRHGEGPLRDRADLMFAAAAVSFVPILCIFAAEWLLRTPLPFYVALLWAFIFPVAVGYGILRRQLFEIRNVAKSSAAHGGASIAITGVFALLITSADALVARLNVNLRWFQVSFLFVAILLFNPLRNRMQSLVDGFFDRDRAAYRVAVREISEAMVSMLSLTEIADRILIALTDTMGVERAMVLLVDDDGARLRPMATRGEWDKRAPFQIEV